MVDLSLSTASSSMDERVRRLTPRLYSEMSRIRNEKDLVVPGHSVDLLQGCVLPLLPHENREMTPICKPPQRRKVSD